MAPDDREALIERVAHVVSGHGPQYVRDVINIIEALGYDIVASDPSLLSDRQVT